MRRKQLHLGLLVVLTLSLALGSVDATTALADTQPLPAPVQRLVDRTDRAVVQSRAGAFWVWGPRVQDNTEDYKEGKEGKRAVFYFEKGRLEITDPAKDPNDRYYATSGLLLREMITGKVQLGDSTYAQREPANVPLAGDIPARIPESPTYASLFNLVSFDYSWKSDDMTGKPVMTMLKGSGQVTVQPDLVGKGVTYARYVPETGHNIAKPFVDFFATRGEIWDGSKFVGGQSLFDPLFVFGYPIAEPYWAQTTVAGKPTTVLVQAFERRLLTFTPENPDPYKVEFGNLGLAYTQWRYKTAPVATDPSVDPDWARPTENDAYKLYSASNDTMRTLNAVKRDVFQGGQQVAVQAFQAPDKATAIEATTYRGQPAQLETIIVDTRAYQRLRVGNQVSQWFYEDLPTPYRWPANFAAFEPISLNDWTVEWGLGEARPENGDTIQPLVAEYFEIDGSKIRGSREIANGSRLLSKATQQIQTAEGPATSIEVKYKDYNVQNAISAPGGAVPIPNGTAGDTGLWNFGEVKYNFANRAAAGTLKNELVGYRQINNYGANGVLVKFKSGLRTSAANSFGVQVARGWEAKGDASPVLYSVNAAQMRQTLDMFRADPRVEYAEPNYRYESHITGFNDPNYANQYYLNAVKAPRAWDFSTGSKAIKVAVLDSGIDLEHPDLKGNIAETYNSDKKNNDVTDYVGHGSWTGGIIGALSNNGVFGSGIAPNVSLLAIRGDSDDDPGFTAASVTEGIRYATDKGARVINLSLGGEQQSNSIRDAINYALGKGVVVIASSGNDGDGRLKYPASYPGVISVGATGLLNQPANFSTYNDKVILSAPGVRICNTVRAGKFACPDGTSASAPIVSAAAALLLTVNPTLTADQVKAILIASAQPVPGKNPGDRDDKYGYGIVDIAKALQIASTNRMPALPANLPK
jgi:thermitase